MNQMRVIHRWTMTVFAVLLVYWVASGLTIAIYDAVDPTQVWAREGGGPGARLDDFAIKAKPLPPPATYAAGIGRALASTRDMPIASVDYRLTQVGIPRLQLAEANGRRGDERRFYAATAQPMSQAVADDDHVNPTLETRNWIKSWHRGDIAGLPGQILGLLTGIALIALTVTGAMVYFKMWSGRRRLDRPGFFWQSRDSLWRRLHRWISIVSAVFVLNIATSGVILAWGEIQLHLFLQYHLLTAPYPRPTSLPAVSDAPLAGDLSAALARTYAAAARSGTVVAVELVHHDGVDKGLATLGGATPRVVAFVAGTGAPTSDWRTRGVQKGAGYFADWHQILKRIHRGDILGSFVGRYVDILAGLALAYLVISGTVLYFQMRRRRVSAGRLNYFWT